MQHYYETILLDLLCYPKATYLIAAEPLGIRQLVTVPQLAPACLIQRRYMTGIMYNVHTVWSKEKFMIESVAIAYWCMVTTIFLLLLAINCNLSLIPLKI